MSHLESGDCPVTFRQSKKVILATVVGIGLAMRPLGAIVIGNLADRKGRKAGLNVTNLLMAAGTALIASMPTHASIGVTATVAGALAVAARVRDRRGDRGVVRGADGAGGAQSTLLSGQLAFCQPGGRGFGGGGCWCHHDRIADPRTELLIFSETGVCGDLTGGMWDWTRTEVAEPDT